MRVARTTVTLLALVLAANVLCVEPASAASPKKSHASVTKSSKPSPDTASDLMLRADQASDANLAVALYRDIEKRFPSSPQAAEAAFREAQYYYAMGIYAKAQRFITEHFAALEQARPSQAWLLLGDAYAAQDLDSDAVVAYRQAHVHAANDSIKALAQVRWARALLKDDKPDSCLTLMALIPADKRAPVSSEARLLVAEALIRVGRADSASKVLARGLQSGDLDFEGVGFAALNRRLDSLGIRIARSAAPAVAPTPREIPTDTGSAPVAREALHNALPDSSVVQPLPTGAAPDPPGGPWGLQLGAFGNIDNARALYHSLKDALPGLAVRTISVGRKPLYRVVQSGWPDEPSALGYAAAQLEPRHLAYRVMRLSDGSDAPPEPTPGKASPR